MKKILFAASLAGICVVFIFLFQDKPDPPIEKKTEQVKQIEFYHYFSGMLSGGLSDMIDQVNKRQTRFHVKATALDHEAFKSMILTTLDKDNPPELFSYWAGARVQNLVDQNKLSAIDDLWENQGLSQRFSPSVVKAACTYNNKKYLLPIDQHFVVFFYNRQLFQDSGLAAPKGWDDFLTVCQALKKKKIIPLALGAKERWPAQFWLDYLLLRTQPIEYRHQLMAGRAHYNDAQIKSVYRIWADLLKNGYFNPDANDLDWAQATQLVCSKKAAMTLMGTWAIPLLKEGDGCENNHDGFDFFTFPIMDPMIGNVALGPIDGIVLSMNADNKEYSKQTLAHFASVDAQKKMSIGSGGMAPSLEVTQDFYSNFKQRLKKEIDASDAWAFNYDLATHPDIAELGMNSFQELIAFPEQYEKILENLDHEVKIVFDQLKKNGSNL